MYEHESHRTTGETRDTAELGLIGAFLSDSLVPRNARVKLFRTWGSGIGMLPIGGPAIWGNNTWAPDDTPKMKSENVTFGCASKLPLLTASINNLASSGKVTSGVPALCDDPPRAGAPQVKVPERQSFHRLKLCDQNSCTRARMENISYCQICQQRSRCLHGEVLRTPHEPKLAMTASTRLKSPTGTPIVGG